MKEKGVGKETAVAREQSNDQDWWKEPSVKSQVLNEGQVRRKGTFSKRFSN